MLWDLGYLLDSSWRMAQGQMPYRDFPFVHPPGTFVIQAGLMRLFGRHFLVAAGWAALASGLGTLLAWRIALRVLQDWGAALALAAPLTVLGLYAVYPHPIYDGDCVLAVLVAVWFLTRQGLWNELRLGTFGSVVSRPSAKEAEGRLGRGWRWAVMAGVAATGPMWFKQNIGFAFVGAVGVCAAVVWVWEWVEWRERRVPWLLAGMGLGLGAGMAMLAGTAGVGNFVQWAVRFAAARRMPGMGPMLEMYRQTSLIWMVPVTLAGLALLGVGRSFPSFPRASAAKLGKLPTLKRGANDRCVSGALQNGGSADELGEGVRRALCGKPGAAELHRPGERAGGACADAGAAGNGGFGAILGEF